MTTRQTFFLGLRYPGAHAAIAWLEQAFGAERHVVYDAPDGTVAHAEMRIAGSVFMLGDDRDDGNPVQTPARAGAATSSMYVVLPDAAAVDALYERAKAAGATILREPNDTDYGSHEFAALDIGGYPWSFGTYDPSEAHAS